MIGLIILNTSITIGLIFRISALNLTKKLMKTKEYEEINPVSRKLFKKKGLYETYNYSLFSVIYVAFNYSYFMYDAFPILIPFTIITILIWLIFLSVDFIWDFYLYLDYKRGCS